MADTEFLATWELGQWITILREHLRADPEQFAEAGGPSVEQQKAIEYGNNRALDDAVIDQYQKAFTALGDEKDGSLFSALLVSCQREKDNDAADRLIKARQEFDHSTFVVGLDIGNTSWGGGEIYGDRIELDPRVKDLLTDTMKTQFVYGLTEIARYYKGLVLARGPRPEHPVLTSLFTMDWKDVKPDGGLHFVGIVPPAGQSGSMYPFDPIAGVRTIRQAVRRAEALGAQRAEVIPAAWAILIANSCATPVTTAIEAWSELAARGRDGFVVGLTADTPGAAPAGLADMRDQLPDAATIWRASTELLTPWRDDYTLAAWDASIQPGAAGAQLGVDRRPPNDSTLNESVWVYDDSHYATHLTTVLADQDITCATITDTTLTIHEPQQWADREPIYWIPARSGRAVLRKASHNDWRAAQVW